MDAAEQNDRINKSLVTKYSESELPTKFGVFRFVVYRDARDNKEHSAIIAGDVAGKNAVPVRIHSECFTGEVLHSLKCDCREQLDLALNHISDHGTGVVVYLRQEGRGIGLGNKIKAYALQSQGADTVDANRMLGFADDLRTYDAAIDILHDLGVSSVNLLTNNPEKIDALKSGGLVVEARTPVLAKKGELSDQYLATKRDRMGHLIPDGD